MPDHLLLDTGAISMTNVNMKNLFLIIGLPCIGLLAQCGLADSKILKERVQRQAYLPPSTKNSITEEIITIHEDSPSTHAQFDESNYGGGKYQIFEVHNHFGSLSANNAAQTGFGGSQYLPPHQEIRVQHIYQHSNQTREPLIYHNSIQTTGTVAKAPKEEVLRVEHIHVNPFNSANVHQNGFKGPGYLPPYSHSNAASKHSVSSAPQSTDFHQPITITYPQTQLGDQRQQHLQGPSVHQQNSQIPFQQDNQFKGSDYLPPHKKGQQGNFNEPHQQFQQVGQYKGPDYLPPFQTNYQHSHHQAQQIGQFKGPGYLPPHHDGEVQHHTNPLPHQTSSHQSYQQNLQSTQYREQDYYQQPAQRNEDHHNEIYQQVGNVTPFEGPDYLPPHQDSNGAVQARPFEGPSYLPPHQHYAQQNQFPQQVQQESAHRVQSISSSHQEHQHSYQQQITQSTAVNGPAYLPPHENNQQPGTLPAGYDYSNPTVNNVAPQHQQHFQQPQQHEALLGPLQLPPGYDFVKPENAEEAIAELHTLPKEDNQEFLVQSQFQVGQHNQQDPAINEYLPPQIPPQLHQPVSANYQSQQTDIQTVSNNVNLVAPQIFPPAPVSSPAETPVQSYAPPATPVQAEQYSANLHSLSSLMSNVQPNERYGAMQFTAPRQPFPEYGPPPITSTFGPNSPSQHQHQPQPQQPVIPPVAPMYQNQASRSPYYAPAMSYATQPLAKSHQTPSFQQSSYRYQNEQYNGLNEQTKHKLQQFMPTEIRQSLPIPIPRAPAQAPAPVLLPRPAISPAAPAVPLRSTSSSRVRTVQILNPTAVKTLKILETSDQSGVKTIKILGSSNKEPIGDHHIVKVVSQDAHTSHEHIQTVKIFNDHEDAPIGPRGAYLPPVGRVVRQLPSKKKQHRTFTGRRRYSN